MHNLKKMLAFYLETPMHAGTGSVINSPIDLPIQREITTKFPTIQSSGVKGNLRDFSKELDGFTDDVIDKIFGMENERGSLSVTDAKLLLFPVRSLDNVFCWITCPLILQRFYRDLEIMGVKADLKVPKVKEEQKVLGSPTSNNGSLTLENYLFEVQPDESVNELIMYVKKLFPSHNTYDYLKERLDSNMFVVNDKIFMYIVNTETETLPRIKIDDEKGVTEEGALFYEEYLPHDTLLYSMLFYNDEKGIDFATKVKEYNDKSLQLGGNFTIGKGFTTMKIFEQDGD